MQSQSDITTIWKRVMKKGKELSSELRMRKKVGVWEYVAVCALEFFIAEEGT